ncbi:hypothetical protein H4R18_004891 [Coemansia javaensis]|uniref:Uncharacterized protein n=1 Tax=Coemansia javaensis TaxID=2761396 RepID=A0A9W8LFM6_9FUNG|nr:hypothetical protein H4R18_004891 [Coemansia javaensis]
MEEDPAAGEARGLSGKLKQMKFMQRSAERAQAAAAERVERRRIDESHWRATYADGVIGGSSEAAAAPVAYEASYLRMPAGDTAVRADGTLGDGASSSSEGGGGVAVGRRSFGAFNPRVEEESRAAEARQQAEQRDQAADAADRAMAAALGRRS